MIRACALMDLPPGEAVRIVGPRAPIANFNTGGVVHSHTAEPTRMPAKRPVRTCSVHVKDGEVCVDVDVNRDVA